MLDNLPRDLKTTAYVLRRTNYNEADRILNLITPEGKISAIAKGVRKSKSKLAGAVEMFILAEVNLHFGKSEMATLTGAKMLKFHGEILKDLSRMEIASEFLKEINRAAETIDSPEFFEILDKCLTALNNDMNQTMVESWFLLNLARVMGEQVNLYTDVDGVRLDAECRYAWDGTEKSLRKFEDGEVDANAIKIMRLMWTTDLDTVGRIKNVGEYVPVVLTIAKAVNNL